MLAGFSTNVALVGALALLTGTASLADNQPLFESADLLEITLSGPIHTVINDREDRARHPLTLTVGDKSLNIEARVRGKSRADVCSFPPLRIYFTDPDSLAGTAFENQTSIKLVTHCYNTSGGDKNVRREYAAYRLFNTLTDAGYRVRMARIKYIDDEGKLAKGASERYAFFIERRKKLAQRLGGETVDTPKITKDELDQPHTALVYTYQDLIGHTDWATSHTYGETECCHNLDLVRVDGKLLLIPFDFDLSEFVDAPYAEPRPGSPLVREERRRARVYCADPEQLENAIDLIVAQWGAINAEIENVPGASDKEVSRMQAKLDQFHRSARKKDKLVKHIDTRCL